MPTNTKCHIPCVALPRHYKVVLRLQVNLKSLKMFKSLGPVFWWHLTDISLTDKNMDKIFFLSSLLLFFSPSDGYYLNVYLFSSLQVAADIFKLFLCYHMFLEDVADSKNCRQCTFAPWTLRSIFMEFNLEFIFAALFKEFFLSGLQKCKASHPS